MSAKGASHPLRIAGAILCDLGLLGNLLLAIYGSLKVA